LYGTRSLESCGVLVGALTAVLWTVLERLISLEVQLVMIQGRKLKNRRARNAGWALARRTSVKCYSLEDSKSPPIPFSIFFLTVP
jgi:hypothetical protein